ncbi:MAG: hypothetical protein ACJAR1_000645 [Rubritalea sp.]|jgi:hypothetical protein
MESKCSPDTVEEIDFEEEVKIYLLGTEHGLGGGKRRDHTFKPFETEL